MKREDVPLFKKGDIVRLKSGGPDMTVDGFYTPTGQYTCQWFSGSKLQHGRFDPKTLTHVKGTKNKEKVD